MWQRGTEPAQMLAANHLFACFSQSAGIAQLCMHLPSTALEIRCVPNPSLSSIQRRGCGAFHTYDIGRNMQLTSMAKSNFWYGSRQDRQPSRRQTLSFGWVPRGMAGFPGGATHILDGVHS